MRQRLRPVPVVLPDYGVFVLESHHAPGFRMATSRHDFLEIFYVLRGTGHFTLSNQSHRCGTGEVIVVPAGTMHCIADDPAEPLSLYGVCISPAVYRLEPSLEQTLPSGRHVLHKLIIQRVRSDLRHMLFEQTLARDGYRALLVGLALQFLGLLIRGTVTAHRHRSKQPPVAASDHASTVQQYINGLPHHFFEPADLDHTAAALGVSRRRFTELFRMLTGTTWLSYLTRLRVDYACQLLQQTQRSISAIAFECGFEDLSSFYRAFERQTGMPPNLWRQRQDGRPG